MLSNAIPSSYDPNDTITDWILDRFEELLDVVDDFTEPRIERGVRGFRTLALRRARNSARGELRSSFWLRHLDRARLLETWAHLEDALWLDRRPVDGGSVSPTGRVLRLCAEIERFVPWRTQDETRLHVDRDIERAAGPEVHALAHAMMFQDRKRGASRLRLALEPLLGAPAASVLIPVYRLDVR